MASRQLPGLLRPAAPREVPDDRTAPGYGSALPEVMLLLLAVILGVAWLMGFVVFHVSTAAIHVLLVLAVVGLIAHLVRGRSATP